MKYTKSYIITGPTSGIGYQTALRLAKHGRVILVGRNQDKLDLVKNAIGSAGHQAYTILADLSDINSARQAAAQIIALNLPIAGLLNNAGIMPAKAAKNDLGWDLTFTTNYLGLLHLRKRFCRTCLTAQMSLSSARLLKIRNVSPPRPWG